MSVPDSLTNVGPYVIERELGRGGMGVVYLARDERLGRLVAVKSLLSLRADDPRAAERLAREARLLASVNHPNVAQIYSLEAMPARPSRPAPFCLVLEYVEGPTLAQRLNSGPLPVREALRIAHATAQGLWAAHRKGIIHRDLKPANVKFTADSVVKVLDFGLAGVHLEPTRGQPVDAGAADPGDAPTATGINILADLEVGAQVSGTPGYMSPEQARGQTVDVRTDIWSLGALTFEILTGVRAFGGATISDAIAETLRGEPAWARLPADTPPEVARLLREMLAREKEARPRDMGHVVAALEEVIRQDPSQASGALDRPSTRALRARQTPHNLPRIATSFVGRRDEIDNASRLLAPGRLVTLVGLGGSGKTRLAYMIAQKALSAFEDGVWAVGLLPLPAGAPSDAVANAISKAIGIKSSPGQSPLESVADTLARKRCLLLLDNCEHVAPACAEVVRAILERIPADSVAGCALLATSRDALDVAGEWCVGVGALSLTARADDADGLSEAALLFIERARSATPHTHASPINRDQVERLCARLDGIPLAIELAAARTRLLTVDQILHRLDDRHRVLGSAPSALTGEGGRRRTLEEAIAWSIGRLDEPDRRLLESLAVFSGGWTLDTAARVVGHEVGDEFAVLEGLAHLVDFSLVRVVDTHHTSAAGTTEVRYGMLESIRNDVLHRLHASDSNHQRWRALVDHHTVCFLSLARNVAHGIHGPEVKIWLDSADAEHGNFEALWERATAPWTRLALWAHLWEPWWLRGWWSEALRRLHAALEGVAALPEDSVPQRMWQTTARLGVGVIERSLGDYDAARRDLTLALDSARAADKNSESWAGPLAATALNHLGGLDVISGQHGRAVASFEEARAWAGRCGDNLNVAYALNNLANVYMGRGRFPEARRMHEQAAALRRSASDLPALAGSLNNLANLCMDEGRHAESRALYEEAFSLNRRLGLTMGMAINLNNIAYAALADEDLDAAHDALRKAEPLARRMGDKRLHAATMNNLGIVAARRGETDFALRSLLGALQMRIELSDLLGIAESFEAMAYPGMVDDAPFALSLMALADRMRTELNLPVLPVDRPRYETHQRDLRARCASPAVCDAAWNEGKTWQWQDAARRLLTLLPAEPRCHSAPAPTPSDPMP